MIVPVEVLKDIAEIEFSEIAIEMFTDLNTMRILNQGLKFL